MIEGIIFGAMMLVATGFTICAMRTRKSPLAISRRGLTQVFLTLVKCR